MSGRVEGSMAMWAIVPCKRLEEAKGRLTPVLAAAERRRLVRAMLRDVLAALREARGLAGIAVVSPDPGVRALAEASGALALADPPAADLSGVVGAAAAVLAARGASGVLVVAADAPLLTAAELERVLAAHGTGRGVTIVPDRAGRGSNAVACTPPGAIAFRYGADSFRRHVEAARERGLCSRCLHMPGLGLDLDTPEDLAVFARSAAGTQTHAVLAAAGIDGRLGRSHQRRAADGEGRT